MASLEDVFAKTMPKEMGFDYISFQEQQAQKGVPPAAIFGLSLLFVFLILAVQRLLETKRRGAPGSI